MNRPESNKRNRKPSKNLLKKNRKFAPRHSSRSSTPTAPAQSIPRRRKNKSGGLDRLRCARFPPSAAHKCIHRVAELKAVLSERTLKIITIRRPPLKIIDFPSKNGEDGGAPPLSDTHTRHRHHSTTIIHRRGLLRTPASPGIVLRIVYCAFVVFF